MALSTFQQQPKQLCYIQTQTSSTTIPSTTINKNTINNPKVNKQQCYYYHNTDNIDEQMSQNACHANHCQFCAITSSQWAKHLFTKEESDLDGRSLSNPFKYEPLHRRLLLFESRVQTRLNESSVYSSPAICHCQYTMKNAHSIVIIWAPNKKKHSIKL